MKTLIRRQYSFQKFTLFSQENQLLEAPPSNFDGFLLRDLYFLQLSSIRLFGKKCAFLHLENLTDRCDSFKN
jgi:hypothetical protein